MKKEQKDFNEIRNLNISNDWFHHCVPTDDI